MKLAGIMNRAGAHARSGRESDVETARRGRHELIQFVISNPRTQCVIAEENASAQTLHFIYDRFVAQGSDLWIGSRFLPVAALVAPNSLRLLLRLAAQTLATGKANCDFPEWKQATFGLFCLYKNNDSRPLQALAERVFTGASAVEIDPRRTASLTVGQRCVSTAIAEFAAFESRLRGVFPTLTLHDPARAKIDLILALMALEVEAGFNKGFGERDDLRRWLLEGISAQFDDAFKDASMELRGYTDQFNLALSWGQSPDCGVAWQLLSRWTGSSLEDQRGRVLVNMYAGELLVGLVGAFTSMVERMPAAPSVRV
jgi:hypothetical protein